MCGFVGIISPFQDPVSNWLVAGNDAISHRGPDDSGEWWSSNGRVGLAHRRLSMRSICHLPVINRCEMNSVGWPLLFNGEIYNFQEMRASFNGAGTAFVPAAIRKCCWRLTTSGDFQFCLSRLNGMFALALFDERRQRVLLARDRAGEKPLFYHLHKGVLRFASELKALLADPILHVALSRLTRLLFGHGLCTRRTLHPPRLR